MYGNLYAREMKGQGVKPEYRFIKMFILCLIIGLLFLTGYENDRIMQELPDMRCSDIKESVRELYLWYQEHIGEIDMYSLIYG